MAVIEGFGFNDTLNGTTGADEIRGLAGNDTIDGNGGDDLLLGGSGNDLIYAFPGPGGSRTTVDGGDGNDSIYIGGNVLWGGPAQVATVTGGAGDDEINHIGQYSGGLYDGGEGNDTFRLFQTEASVTVRLGVGGVDTVFYITESIPFTPAVLRVEQFNGGAGGDVLVLGLIPLLKNWDQSNPFTGGYLRLVTDGIDTVVQVDEDGGGNGFHDLIRLASIYPSAITTYNLSGYDPAGGPTVGKVFVGSSVQVNSWVQIDATAGGDTITGQATNDLLHGFAGNDLIDAGGGNDLTHAGYGDDTVNAGSGNDTITDDFGSNYLRGDDGNDSVSGGPGFDDINGNAGNDTLSGGLSDDWVVGGKDNDSLSGGAGADLVYGNLGADTCDGGDGADIVRGGQDNDSLNGGAGDDYVSGDKGSDTVAGGAGADIFHTFGDAGFDRVLDFNLIQGDRVQVDPGTQYTVSQVGSDTVINMTGGGQMILVGVQMSSLAPGWIFGA